VLIQQFFFNMSARRPAGVKAKLVELVEKEVGTEQARHFTPEYNPWDQRLCLAPDGDLFAAMRAGTASVATGAIERSHRRDCGSPTGQRSPPTWWSPPPG
jgi:cation diffusion facilitator CzcD-associated flavoprotein CzcO